MNQVKNTQENLVKEILENASCGPQSAESVGGYAVARGMASLPHVAFVMEQLSQAGQLKQIPDGRYITTNFGELMLLTLNTTSCALTTNKSQYIVANVL
ncbi:hypothetical protein [Vibrio echinoideorum]|uniref:hypothetical protein n=1 Tax=Vibrio echinoideorum TaxID=2100116 RepID=UPI0035509248